MTKRTDFIDMPPLGVAPKKTTLGGSSGSSGSAVKSPSVTKVAVPKPNPIKLGKAPALGGSSPVSKGSARPSSPKSLPKPIKVGQLSKAPSLSGSSSSASSAGGKAAVAK